MTLYAVNKILWLYGRDPTYRSDFNADPASHLSGDELTDAERAALVSKDIRSIFEAGAHPFLLYSFAIQLNGGWSYPFMLDYVERLKGLELGDIET